MARNQNIYLEYLEEAANKYDVPLELLQKIVEIEEERQFQFRRDKIFQSLRKEIMKWSRE